MIEPTNRPTAILSIAKTFDITYAVEDEISSMGVLHVLLLLLSAGSDDIQTWLIFDILTHTIRPTSLRHSAWNDAKYIGLVRSCGTETADGKINHFV